MPNLHELEAEGVGTDGETWIRNLYRGTDVAFLPAAGVMPATQPSDAAGVQHAGEVVIRFDGGVWSCVSLPLIPFIAGYGYTQDEALAEWARERARRL